MDFHPVKSIDMNKKNSLKVLTGLLQIQHEKNHIYIYIYIYIYEGGLKSLLSKMFI